MSKRNLFVMFELSFVKSFQVVASPAHPKSRFDGAVDPTISDEAVNFVSPVRHGLRDC
jgi:hypothetical protein